MEFYVSFCPSFHYYPKWWKFMCFVEVIRLRIVTVSEYKCNINYILCCGEWRSAGVEAWRGVREKKRKVIVIHDTVGHLGIFAQMVAQCLNVN